MKIQFFKKERNFKKEKENLRADMNFYWKLAVCLMLVIIILFAVFGYYLFVRINKESAVSFSSAGNQITTVKKERIEKVLEYFSLRKQKSIEILNSPAPVADPSL